MLSRESISRSVFVYNGKMHVLRTEKHRDAKVEAEMQRRGLAAPGAYVLRLNGAIENEGTHEHTAFTVWYQEGCTILPLRFEFKPKSYLKLVFDARPEQAVTSGASFPDRESGLQLQMRH
jgi:hypothetical protein